MFVKFENNKSVHTTNICPEGDEGKDFVECSDSLMGQRLVKDGKKIRAMTKDERAQELEELRAAYLARETKPE